jgi:UDP-N-acetylglucosamine 2-epimerase (non-hydrolysing)
MSSIRFPQRKIVLCVVGTRPEAIKMAPVILALRKAPWATCRLLVTGQHRELLDQALALFDLQPDVDLNVMRSNQSLPALTSRLLLGLDEALAAEPPDLVLAQGDTTSVLAAALASFYRRIPFGHVEAGLRTHQLDAPFPEEGNRVLAGRLACLHFAPTDRARDNLLAEGVPAERIHVTGNTVIDALYLVAARNAPIGVLLDDQKRLILVTAHRRDSFGAALQGICRAIARLSREFADVEFLWPVHPNPSVRGTVLRLMEGVARVRCCDPLPYDRFVTALRRAHIILTDSGGVAEEAPTLGKPILILRDQTERLEAVEAGVARLVGVSEEAIVEETSRLLNSAGETHRRGSNVFGDGKAAGRIVAATAEFLGATPLLSVADSVLEAWKVDVSRAV